MQFQPASIQGVWLIRPDRHADARGFFARTWCAREFAQHGLRSEFVQSSTSFNRQRGTVRGVHFQRWPHTEEKLVRCTRGRVFDVVVDIRPESATCRRWQAFELSEANGDAVFIPEGCAHGFQTLTDKSELLYQMTGFYEPSSAAGFHFADPAIGIEWPERVSVISPNDEALPSFDELESHVVSCQPTESVSPA